MANKFETTIKEEFSGFTISKSNNIFSIIMNDINGKTHTFIFDLKPQCSSIYGLYIMNEIDEFEKIYKVVESEQIPDMERQKDYLDFVSESTRSINEKLNELKTNICCITEYNIKEYNYMDSIMNSNNVIIHFKLKDNTNYYLCYFSIHNGYYSRRFENKINDNVNYLTYI
jgi:hypothetical protein